MKTQAVPQIRAIALLRQNIGGLLVERRYKQKDLAFWCGHSEAWISAFLRGERDLPMKDLDRIADFFGLATYQLFQPGIAPTTERRRGVDRRSGRDRRISAAQRNLAVLAQEVKRARRHKASDGA